MWIECTSWSSKYIFFRFRIHIHIYIRHACHKTIYWCLVEKWKRKNGIPKHVILVRLYVSNDFETSREHFQNFLAACVFAHKHTHSLDSAFIYSRFYSFSFFKYNMLVCCCCFWRCCWTRCVCAAMQVYKMCAIGVHIRTYEQASKYAHTCARSHSKNAYFFILLHSYGNICSIVYVVPLFHFVYYLF